MMTQLWCTQWNIKCLFWISVSVFIWICNICHLNDSSNIRQIWDITVDFIMIFSIYRTIHILSRHGYIITISYQNLKYYFYFIKHINVKNISKMGILHSMVTYKIELLTLSIVYLSLLLHIMRYRYYIRYLLYQKYN